MATLQIIDKAEIDALTALRTGETKLGSRVQWFSADHWEKELAQSSAVFVILGIPEDIGVRANSGIGGTRSLWPQALKSLLNVQDTRTLPGNALAVLGGFDFSELHLRAQQADLPTLREMVHTIDEAVCPVILSICKAGKIPIVIGGGHNNAYPLLKGASKAFGKMLQCVNLDAHSDYRPIEGRHSGNGFRYARMDGYLKRYAVLGLHRNYNSQAVLDDMAADPDISVSFYEDAYIEQSRDFAACVESAFRFAAGAPTGIELDLDCIEGVLSSAATPAGIRSVEARRYLTYAARFADVAYLHIAEGSTQMDDGREDRQTAKLVSYLITDFVRAYLNQPKVVIRPSEM